MLCTINITVFYGKVKGGKKQSQKSVKSAEIDSKKKKRKAPKTHKCRWYTRKNPAGVRRIFVVLHEQRAAMSNPLCVHIFFYYTYKKIKINP